MNVKKMVAEHLKVNGFDGLWNCDCECACDIDDLAPCGNIYEDCQAGYLGPCDCGEHDFHIQKAKPEGKEAPKSIVFGAGLDVKVETKLGHGHPVLYLHVDSIGKVPCDVVETADFVKEVEAAGGVFIHKDRLGLYNHRGPYPPKEVECPGCHTTLRPLQYDGPVPEEFRWSLTCFNCHLNGHGSTPAEAVREFQRDSRRKLWNTSIWKVWLKDEYHRRKDS